MRATNTKRNGNVGVPFRFDASLCIVWLLGSKTISKLKSKRRTTFLLFQTHKKYQIKTLKRQINTFSLSPTVTTWTKSNFLRKITRKMPSNCLLKAEHSAPPSCAFNCYQHSHFEKMKIQFSINWRSILDENNPLTDSQHKHTHAYKNTLTFLFRFEPQWKKKPTTTTTKKNYSIYLHISIKYILWRSNQHFKTNNNNKKWWKLPYQSHTTKHTKTTNQQPNKNKIIIIITQNGK